MSMTKFRNDHGMIMARYGHHETYHDHSMAVKQNSIIIPW